MKNGCRVLCALFLLSLLLSCAKTHEADQNSKAPKTDNENTTASVGYSLSNDVPVELMQKDGEAFTKQDAVDLVKYMLPNAIRIMLLYSNTDPNYTFTPSSATIKKYGEIYHAADLLPYKTIKELKTETESIYTSEFAKKSFYDRAFVGNEDHPPIYMEHKGKLYCIDVSTGYDTSWLYDTAEIIDQSTSKIKVSIHTLLFEEPVKEPSILEFIKEPDGWRLNSSIED